MFDQRVKDMVGYNAAYLNMISGKYGGDSTLNEIRVMNFVLRANLAGKDVGVSCVSRVLGIPKSTVSRAVLKFRANGWLEEVTSNSDGRRRNLRLTRKVVDRFQSELDVLQQHWPQAA